MWFRSAAFILWSVLIMAFTCTVGTITVVALWAKVWAERQSSNATIRVSFLRIFTAALIPQAILVPAALLAGLYRITAVEVCIYTSLGLFLVSSFFLRGTKWSKHRVLFASVLAVYLWNTIGAVLLFTTIP